MRFWLTRFRVWLLVPNRETTNIAFRLPPPATLEWRA